MAAAVVKRDDKRRALLPHGNSNQYATGARRARPAPSSHDRVHVGDLAHRKLVFNAKVVQAGTAGEISTPCSAGALQVIEHRRALYGELGHPPL